MKKTKLTFIADTHHFSRTLSKPGRAYNLRSGSDQKCLNETGPIIDTAFDYIASSDTDAVLIAGDLTNDGEAVCHNEFRNKLYALQKNKPVYVITATHDWCCDENPRRFDGDKVTHDVETVPHEELRDFYYDFGPKDADSEFITHLGTCSYTVDVGENVRILALNDDQNGQGRAGFKEDHFQWIESQIKKAKSDGKIMIGMEHHLLIAHVHPLITGGGTCVGNREYVASRLADAGLKFMFVGHSHIQAIDSFTSEKGNTIYEINVGSLCGYPSPIVNVTVSQNKIEIETDHIKSFVFDGIEYDTLAYTAKKANDLIDRVLDCSNLGKKEFCDRLTALQLKGESFAPYYFALKPVLKLVSTLKVKNLYRILKTLGLAKNVKNSDIIKFANVPVTDFVHDFLHSFMDGSAKRHEQGSYYNVVIGFADALIKIKPCKLTEDFKEVLHRVTVGGEYNINNCSINF